MQLWILLAFFFCKVSCLPSFSFSFLNHGGCPSRTSARNIVQYYYGPRFTLECHCTSKCDAKTGECPTRCLKGATRNREGRCVLRDEAQARRNENVFHTYGKDCQDPCNSIIQCDSWSGNVSHNEDCMTGYALDIHSKCVEMHCADEHEEAQRNCTSCMPGYFGKTCIKFCTFDRWGEYDDNQNNCKNYCNCQTSCNKVTGECPSLCSSGYRGWNCQEACEDGTWGEGNEISCPNRCDCDEGVVCERKSGGCEFGWCSRRFAGPRCTLPCAPGYWGANCDHSCVRQEGHTCDTFTGECTSRCRCKTNGVIRKPKYGLGGVNIEMRFHNAGLKKMSMANVGFYRIEVFDREWVDTRMEDMVISADNEQIHISADNEQIHISADNEQIHIVRTVLPYNDGEVYVRMAPYIEVHNDLGPSCFTEGMPSRPVLLHVARAYKWPQDTGECYENQNCQENELCYMSGSSCGSAYLPGCTIQNCTLKHEAALKKVDILDSQNVFVSYENFEYENESKRGYHVDTILQYCQSSEVQWQNTSLEAVSTAEVQQNVSLPIKLHWYTKYHFRLAFVISYTSVNLLETRTSNIVTVNSGCLYHSNYSSNYEKQSICRYFCYCDGVYCARADFTGDCKPADVSCSSCDVRLPTADEIRDAINVTEETMSAHALPNVDYYEVSYHPPSPGTQIGTKHQLRPGDTLRFVVLLNGLILITPHLAYNGHRILGNTIPYGYNNGKYIHKKYIPGRYFTGNFENDDVKATRTDDENNTQNNAVADDKFNVVLKYGLVGFIACAVVVAMALCLVLARMNRSKPVYSLLKDKRCQGQQHL